MQPHQGAGVRGAGVRIRALAEHAAREPGDRDQALLWLHKSLDAWRAGKLEPGFALAHQREMDQVTDALARLERR